MADTYIGDFNLSGSFLRKRGLNRIGNLIAPNDNYIKFEDWVMPILDTMLEEQKNEVCAGLVASVDESSMYSGTFTFGTCKECPGALILGVCIFAESYI